MTIFKKILNYYFERIKRFYSKLQLIFKFLHNGCRIRKVIHAQGIKYFSMGKNVQVYPYARIDIYKTKGNTPCFCIGDNVVICYYFSALVTTNLIIERNTLIASHVFISTENHGTNPENGSYLKQPLVSADVKICENAWIGEKVIILPGVTIGANSIIGAGSVVTKSIPPFCIACGNPAKVIKKYNKDTHDWEIV